MNKYTLPLLAVFGLLAYVAIATQDATLTQKQVRNPKYLEGYLETNATDAESRIASLEGGSTVGSVLPGYIIVGSSSTAGVDVAVSGDMSITTSGVVTVTGATGAFTVLGTTGAGIDTAGATALYVGEATATSVVIGATDADAVIPGEATIDGKYAIVGGDATTGLMVQAVGVTAGAGASETITFAVVFGGAPVITCTYAEDPGDFRPIFVTSVTPSNFVANITADKNYNYVAVGARP